jgi:hypothetical protein
MYSYVDLHVLGSRYTASGQRFTYDVRVRAFKLAMS